MALRDEMTIQEREEAFVCISFVRGMSLNEDEYVPNDVRKRELVPFFLGKSLSEDDERVPEMVAFQSLRGEEGLDMLHAFLISAKERLESEGGMQVSGEEPYSAEKAWERLFVLAERPIVQC